MSDVHVRPYSLNYYSLADRRCCDFIQRMRASLEYRTERPNRRNGGPSPRMRALANQEKLTRRNRATSFGVSSSSRLGAVWAFERICVPFSIMAGLGNVGYPDAPCRQKRE
jgi:hypothetical protein